MDEEQEKTWQIISGNRAWDVYIGHNYYNGRDYDYHHRPFPVQAANEEDARQAVLNNLAVVENRLRIKHFQNRRLIRKSEGYYISERDIGQIKTSMLISGKVLNRLGEIVPWSRGEVA